MRPSPAATVAERTTASVERSLRIRPSTRCEMNGSTIAIRPWSASSPTARAHASRVGAVAASSGSMRSSILPPWNPASAIAAASYAVNRSSISNVGAGESTAVHGPDDDLAVERAHAAAGPRGCPACRARRRRPGRARAVARRSSSSHRSAMAIGASPARSAPRAGWSAATSMSRPFEPLSPSGRRRSSASRAIAARVVDADLRPGRARSWS